MNDVSHNFHAFKGLQKKILVNKGVQDIPNFFDCHISGTWL
jgi:hypothetical protein